MKKTYDMYDYIYSIFIRERKGGKSKKGLSQHL